MRKSVIDSSFKFIIDGRLEGKIRYMCDKFKSTEWSGILFFNVESGSLQENNLVLRARDFYLLDIGTSVYTEYDPTPDVTGYQIDNDLLDCYWSLMHSHHGMATSFSGTDMNTLERIGDTMNHCLSLIVNNDGKYTAKLTRLVDEKIKCNVTSSYNSFEDEKMKYSYKYNTDRKNLEWIPADIEIEDAIEPSEEEKAFIDEKIESINNKKKEELARKFDNSRWDFDTEDTKCQGYTGWLWHEDMVGNDNANNNANDDDEYVKKFLYMLITGDLFPARYILNSNVEYVIRRSIDISDIKSYSITQMAKNPTSLSSYIDLIVSFSEFEFMEKDVVDNILSILESHSDNEWISLLHEYISDFVDMYVLGNM